MPVRVVTYVCAIAGAAVIGVAAVALNVRLGPTSWWAAALCMAFLGFLAQVLSHAIGQASYGSIASIPYLAGTLLVPDWRMLALVCAVEAVHAVLRKRAPVKSIFNIAQLVLASAISTIAYVGLGGVSMLANSQFKPLPYIGAVVAFFLVNTLSVSGVLAISESRKVFVVWRQITRSALLYDLLASPLAFVFAIVFVSKGILGAVLLALPLLAVRQVFRTSWQLELATQDLLKLMVKAIEARDPYTSGHSQRVQEYSLTIGRIAGLSSRKCDRLGTAALLHDVGKIHEIYAPILRKPDKLTAEEWTIMKTHPIKSAELAGTVSQLKDLLLPIRHHHENWDGSGYPDGLVGEAIPVWARIIAIADTIDAMTTDRPYRRALSVDQVKMELVAMAGRQFDPSLCAALVNSLFFDKLRNMLPESAQSVPSLTISGRQSRIVV